MTTVVHRKRIPVHSPPPLGGRGKGNPMDQTTARKLSRALRERSGGRSIFVALTVDHLEGEFDGPDPQWIVINIASPWERITEVPDGVELEGEN